MTELPDWLVAACIDPYEEVEFPDLVSMNVARDFSRTEFWEKFTVELSESEPEIVDLIPLPTKNTHVIALKTDTLRTLVDLEYYEVIMKTFEVKSMWLVRTIRSAPPLLVFGIEDNGRVVLAPMLLELWSRGGYP